MNETPKLPRAMGWAVAALVLVLGGPGLYAILMDHALIRSTGAPAFGLMSAGVVLGGLAAWRDRRRSVRVIWAVDIVLSLVFTGLFFVGAALPEAPALAQLETAPDFTLPDHTGQPVSLREARANGPVLLVFYRGHW